MNNVANPIDVIFWQAGQRAPGPDRDAYLADACGDDRALRRRVEQLLRVQPKANGFLEEPFAGPAPEIDVAGVGERSGDRIGPYKLLEQIGEGGMGLVFMAEQAEPIRRRVALKVVKPGMDTKQVVARFEAERQALALMDHPHIAKVHDAGTTAAGRPYFVMELVRGVPVTDFCDQHRLDTRRRLELFVQVCRAVQHAHQKGIIHRDLKPSNILVTLHDTMAVPKVIDFGIAKATGQRLTDRTLFTHFAQMVGTPLYMSPEQAEMNGLDVDTRSDVYALGVLLYELLTGTTPFESARLKQVGFDEMRRLIREEEPPRPSERVSTLQAAALTTLSERRGVDVRRCGPMLRGELDWVVMRALEKDRNRRYESASALAADVERYLADEPVEAGPPSAAYRLRKYARRNRRLLVVAGLFAVTLVAATAVSTWQAVKARDAQHYAEMAEQRAITEAAIARAVNDFLQDDLLGQAANAPTLNIDFGVGPFLTVREAVHRASDRIDQAFQDQPLVEAAIRTTVGKAYISLGQNPLAVPHMERAVELRKAWLGSDHPDTHNSMYHLAVAYEWAGRIPDAITQYKHILDDRLARLGPDHPDTLASMSRIAGAYYMAGQWETSIRLSKELLERIRSTYGAMDSKTFGIMHLLAMSYGNSGQHAESMALHEKVLDALKTTNGPGHESTHWPTLTFAQVCQRAGKLEQADSLLREALDQNRKRDNAPGRRIGTANACGWLALNLVLQQQYSAAEPLAHEAVSIWEQLQPNSQRRFYFMSVLGNALLGQKRYAEAEVLLLNGYEGMKQLDAIMPAAERLRMAEAGERIVRYYEVTKQPEKAREWRAKLSTPAGSAK